MPPNPYTDIRRISTVADAVAVEGHAPALPGGVGDGRDELAELVGGPVRGHSAMPAPSSNVLLTRIAWAPANQGIVEKSISMSGFFVRNAS